MPSIRIRPQLLLPALTLVTLVACARSETAASTPSSAVSVANAEAAAPLVTSEASEHAFHYDLALTITEGTTTQKTSFTLDVSDRVPGAVTIGKNVALGKGTGFAVARSDVGTSVKAKLAMEGDVPRLDVEANVSSLDAKGAIHRSSNKVLVATPVDTSVVVFDKTEDGRQTRLTATAHAATSLGAPAAAEPNASHVLDVVAVQSGAGGTPKTTNLSLKLTGDTPATERKIETIPLSVTDGGVAPRQDTGTRVKATARPRASGMELDFDLEISAGEPGPTSAMTIRKITARGPVLVTFDKPSTVFVAEEDGHHYEVTVTPHR